MSLIKNLIKCVLFLNGLFLLLSSKAFSQSNFHSDEIEDSTPFSETNESNSFIDDFQSRYVFKDVYAKLINNYGNGFEPLYGLRNLRVVLNGLMYRSGANNYYNRDGKRNNSNPIPQKGLQNLCKEGFHTAIYMYSTGYSKKMNPVHCETFASKDEGSSEVIPSRMKGPMNYLQISPLTRSSQYQILKIVYDQLLSPANGGPVLVHCWNGWHASGLISAIALKQFCDYSGEEASNYWKINTDGDYKSRTAQSYMRIIKAFQPFDDLKIDKNMKELLCL